MEVRVKVWIEDENKNLIFGSGKTEILKYIEQTGSSAKAAKLLDMNYKKAWSHIKILEELIEDDLVLTKKGQAQDSGTKLTKKAQELMQLYKTLDEDIKEYSTKRFKELFLDKESLVIKETNNVQA